MSQIVRTDDMRRQNRSQVLAALRNSGPLSRTEIGNMVGLSAATITAITADLSSDGVLLQAEDSDPVVTTRGRPRIALSFNPRFACIGIITLQLNKIVVSVADYLGQEICSNEVSLKTAGLSSEELLLALSNSFSDCLERSKCPSMTLKHITVGLQGATDAAGTMLLWSPITDQRNVLIQQHLQQLFASPVSVHNDCNMIARALRRLEPTKYNSEFAAILLSQGIGMGLYQNGKLVQGRISSGTEFGHMVHVQDGALCRCGRRGCIEAYAGDYAIFRSATGQANSSPPPSQVSCEDQKATLDRARDGVGEAIAAYERAGTAIGSGLASLYALFDPFPIALIGAGAAAGDLIEKPILKAIGKTQTPSNANNIVIGYYPEEMPLIVSGCAITALMAVDKNHAAEKSDDRSVEVRNVVG